MSKILKKNSVVIDSAKKRPIPISGMPVEEIEDEVNKLNELNKSDEIAEADDEFHEYNFGQLKDELPEEKPPESAIREYDFEDFNFAEQDSIMREKERERDEEAAAQMLADAQSRSDEIIAQAARNAELIIMHTLDNAKNELSNAITAGYSDGFEAGKNESLKILEPAMNKINLLMETISRLQDKMLYEFRDSMFNIISEISNKIVHKEISEDNHYLLGLFADAIQNIKAEEFVTITVAESELKVATRNKKLFLAEIPHIKDFKILPEKNAAKGTMIVETEKTVVDASVDAQLENVNYLLEQMKENLDIPRTVDDVINQMSSRSIEEQAEMMAAEEYQGDDDGASADEPNVGTPNENGNINQEIDSENLPNFDDISDEDILKYFNSNG